jgi:glycosyl transferase family 25
MRTFIINLDRSPDRLARMQAQAGRLGLAFERFQAVDGIGLTDDLAPYFCDGAGRIMSPLKPGEIGCYASHLGVWRRIVTLWEPASLVLEDDAVLADDLPSFLQSLLAALPRGWDLVHLCREPERAFRPLADLGDGRRLIRYSRVPTTTTGYLVSRSGAARMLLPIEPRMWCVDQDLRFPWRFGLDVYGVTPPPISPRGEASTIGRGSRSRLRRGLRASPLRSPASLAWNMRKLGPWWWLRCLAVNCGVKLRAAMVPLTRRRGRP